MKWIPIDKAKVKFGQLYLCQYPDGPIVGKLCRSVQVEKGVNHVFAAHHDNDVEFSSVTHIAIITDPNKE